MSAIAGFPTSALPQRSENAYESLTSDDFIRVMFAELTRQDPTKPTESKDLLQQIGTIRSIESDLTLTRRLQDIARQNEVASAGQLIGTYAEGLTEFGQRTHGFVDSVSITRNGTVLNLSSGYGVPLSRIDRIYDPALIAPAPPGGTQPPGAGTPPPVDEAPGQDDDADQTDGGDDENNED
jgi:hypothetical protein